MQQWIKNSFECKHKGIKLNSVSVAFNSNFKNIKFFLKLKQTIKNEEKKKCIPYYPPSVEKKKIYGEKVLFYKIIHIGTGSRNSLDQCIVIQFIYCMFYKLNLFRKNGNFASWLSIFYEEFSFFSLKLPRSNKMMIFDENVQQSGGV